MQQIPCSEANSRSGSHEHFYQGNARIVSQIGHNPAQFIIYEATNHSTLYVYTARY
jgi:hypothetical protein